MLNVSLGTGTLEIRSALLNTDYLDAQLVRSFYHAKKSTNCLAAVLVRGQSFAHAGNLLMYV
jgi:hypothetical protein